MPKSQDSSSNATKAATPSVAPPCVMVIFGAGGDLTKRLVTPALYNLVTAKRLPDGFRLVGVDHGARSVDDWRKSLTDMMNEFVSNPGGEFHADKIDQTAWKWLTDRMSYQQGEFQDPETYKRLTQHLADLDKSGGTGGNHLFYLAVAPRFFSVVVSQLGAAGMVTEQDGKWRRVVVEKPFGQDLPSAKALNAEILKVLQEQQIYRMDHFLGKETVQNIMALRFANGLFEPLWNREHIDHVQITAAETVGVEGRGRFYEATGALRDMVPNHVFQLLSLTAMEPPISFDAEAVRDKKAEVIQAIRPLKPRHVVRDVVRGQYDAGTVLGKPEVAYRQEPNVSPESAVETYIAWKLQIDNWRWAGVPFYLRTGKHLKSRWTEVAIRFHQAPYTLFRGTNVERTNPNWMILRLQPDEGIALEFAAKRPGLTMTLGNVAMDFSYKAFFDAAPSTGYETLLYDCMIGDATLFQRADNIEAGWRAVQPIIDYWGSHPATDLTRYASGSDGPAAADDLLGRSGRAWRALE
jgi:glucose-6-phosphate 1-dehydrogenase